jgi:hypothetical protein
MQIFNTHDEKAFYYNNSKYASNYLVHKVGEDAIAIYNAYDTRMQLMSATHFSEVSVDDNIFDSQNALMDVLSTIVFNKVAGGAFGGTQNNKANYYQFGALPGEGDITPSEVADWLNSQEYSLNIGETETPILMEFLRMRNGINTKFIFLFKEGKGLWGAANGGGLTNRPVYPTFFVLLSVQSLTLEDVSNDPLNTINDLGDVPDSNFVEVANATEWNFTDDEQSYYFSYTQDEVLYFVLFIGQSGIYGGGDMSALDFTESDFVATTNSNVQPQVIPTLQQVVSTGNFVDNNEIIFNDRPVPNSQPVQLLKVNYSGLKYIKNSKQTNIKFLEPSVDDVTLSIPAKGVNDTFAMISDIVLPTGLAEFNEGNGIGWRLKSRNPAFYGNIGYNAVDLSINDTNSQTYGATGNYSFAQGYYATASGQFSHAIGFNVTSSGDYSYALGYSSIASGYNSIAAGQSNFARSKAEFSAGMLGTDYTPTSPNGFSLTDRLVNFGNGEFAGTRSDAFTLLKNGLLRLPSVTNALINASDGKAVVTKEWVNSVVTTGTTGGGTWGSISGTLSAQTDLQTALNSKFTNPTGSTANYLRGDGSQNSFATAARAVNLTGFISSGGTVVQGDTILGAIGKLDGNTNIISTALTNKIGIATGSPISVKEEWFGTQAQYSAITPSTTTAYFIEDTGVEVKGSATVSANTTTAINIPHTLGVVPTYVNVQAKSANAAGITFVSATTTNLVVNYATPPSGTLQYWVNYKN